MTLDEAIKHAREVAEDKRADADWKFRHGRLNADDCISCAEEHDQLADWLEELKMYKSLSPRELVSAKQKNDRVIEYSKGFDFGYKTAYSKAIDDFAEKIAIYGTYDYWGNVVDVLEIAEKLKKRCEE